ncbi:uncharacterized protein LOC131298613 [Rhododendron vialii]|uniref:uncharacterized protein LOC131298613 n=1 Tax=Rhododendron vialii TaxID=182163 RepID=UPI0026603F11|nr:uncharacterized protein LOC131298613 [Rhododendron vialii]
MRKLKNETLRQYAERYWQLFNEISGIDEYWATRTFKNGLETGSKILDELAIRPPPRMGELMRVVERFCALEEFYADRAAQGIPSLTASFTSAATQLPAPAITQHLQPKKQALLERLAAQGHLDQYIDRAKTPARQTNPNPNEQRPLIHVIHGPMTKASETALKANIDHASTSKQILSVGCGSKRQRPQDAPKWTISFTERDLEHVQTPHSDALVVTIQIGVHDVKRVLIDQGSSTEVMYYDLFKKLDLPESALQPTDVPLIGFNSAPVVRFIGATGRQEDLRGDQVAFKKYYVYAIHNSAKAKQVQWVEVPDVAVIDDVGQEAEDKAEEDLV